MARKKKIRSDPNLRRLLRLGAARILGVLVDDMIAVEIMGRLSCSQHASAEMRKLARGKHAVGIVRLMGEEGVIPKSLSWKEATVSEPKPTPPKKAKATKLPPAGKDPFYHSAAWKTIRYEALKRSRGCCDLCGARSGDGVRLNVDHIKPRRKFPELSLDLSNLQVLCGSCNYGKGNRDQTDWRIEPLQKMNSVRRLGIGCNWRQRQESNPLRSTYKVGAVHTATLAYGAGDRPRTCCLRITKTALCLMSYPGIWGDRRGSNSHVWGHIPAL